MKRSIKMGLMGLLAMGLLASCNKPEPEEKPFVPQEPELQADYTEPAFGINMEMVYVKGGEFTMGFTPEQGLDIPDSIIRNLPDSIVNNMTRKTKMDSYHIGKYEVTQAQWKAVMGSDVDSAYSYGAGDDYPVYYVSWNDAQEFCKKLSEQTGKKYVLPTDAMWEYAARGGVHHTKTMYAGSNDINEVAWYYGNSDSTAHPVGTKKANALGIHDMSGNVWEWCSDWYVYTYDNDDLLTRMLDALLHWYVYTYDKNDDYNPQGPVNGTHRVSRGGCWGFFGKGSCRVSMRFPSAPADRVNCLGFRVAVLP